jgi:hypothetical protein
LSEPSPLGDFRLDHPRIADGLGSYKSGASLSEHSPLGDFRLDHLRIADGLGSSVAGRCDIRSGAHP